MGRPRKKRRQSPPPSCPACGGDLVEGACAFCPPLEAEPDEKDQELAELESYFGPSD